jgi:hypothetical protein
VVFNDSATANGSAAFTFNKSSNTITIASNGIFEINNISSRRTATSTTTSTSQFAFVSVPAATYVGGEFTIQGVLGANVHLTKLLVAANSTAAIGTEYGTIFNGAAIFTTDVDVTGGNIRILITPSSSTSTAFKTSFELITA